MSRLSRTPGENQTALFDDPSAPPLEMEPQFTSVPERAQQLVNTLGSFATHNQTAGFAIARALPDRSARIDEQYGNGVEVVTASVAQRKSRALTDARAAFKIAYSSKQQLAADDDEGLRRAYSDFYQRHDGRHSKLRAKHREVLLDNLYDQLDYSGVQPLTPRHSSKKKTGKATAAPVAVEEARPKDWFELHNKDS